MVGAVDNGVAEKIGVGDEEVVAVVGADFGRAQPGGEDGAGLAVDFDDIADAKGAGNQNDDAADEVAAEVLRAESEAEGNGAAKKIEDGEGDAKHSQGGQNEERPQEEERPARGQVEGAGGGGCADVRDEALAYEAGDEPTDEPAARHEDDGEEDIADGQ